MAKSSHVSRNRGEAIMSKREEIRARRKKERLRNRLIAILLVLAGALVITFVLVLPGIRNQQKAGQVVEITPGARKAAEHGLSLGDPNAKVKMDVWEDFQCSGCEAYSKSVEPAIIQTYVETGKVYYTFHNAPFIDGGSGESHQAANAAMCANAQNRFWDYHDMLFANWSGENQGAFVNSRLVTFAEKLNLDMTAFNQCFKANTYSQQIQDDYTTGKNMGVPPTPGIFLNGNKVVSSAGENYIPSVEDISKAIDALLASE
jgi:protein-disulfide isomerase